MIIKDHISFFTPNPLIGKNIDELGPRFPDMSEPYKKVLDQKAKDIAAKNNFDIKEGVYVAVTGPTFETRAEYKLITCSRWRCGRHEHGAGKHCRQSYGNGGICRERCYRPRYSRRRKYYYT